MKQYQFFEEYQKQNVYNQMLKFLIKISIIPALIFTFSAIVFRLNAITFFCLICFLVLAYFIFCINFINKKRGECRGKENEFLKKLLKKYDYYSERKINILIKICEEEILIKKEKKQLLISIVMFILPFFISIIALFQIQERTKLVIFLTISLIILLIILILYYCFKYINSYIRALHNKIELDYDGLKNELYDILLTESFQSNNILSIIKNLFK